jgi:hypothetical protein
MAGLTEFTSFMAQVNLFDTYMFVRNISCYDEYFTENKAVFSDIVNCD